MSVIDDLRSVLEIPRWMMWAECANRGINPESFFPEDGVVPAEVIGACAVCPVRVQCLEYGAEQEEREQPGSVHPDRHGVWGGYNPRGRRALRSGKRAQPIFARNFMIANGKKRQERVA